MTRRARSGAVVVAALAVALVLAWGVSPASAHTELVETRPGIDAVVDSGTDSVLLAFSDPVLPDLVRATVIDSAGVDHVRGRPIVDGGRVLIPLGPLEQADHYVVAFRVVGEDGHEVTGGFGFDLTGAGSLESVGLSPPDPGADPFGDARAAAGRLREPGAIGVPPAVIVLAGTLALALVLRSGGRGRGPSSVTAGETESILPGGRP